MIRQRPAVYVVYLSMFMEISAVPMSMLRNDRPLFLKPSRTSRLNPPRRHCQYVPESQDDSKYNRSPVAVLPVS
ncbi:integral membrane protein [Moniliophthora roreri]|nr:integral membrane protein [Moniliophthora roreri]